MSRTKRIGIIVFDGVLTSEITAPAEVFGIAVEQDWFNDWSVQLVSVNRQDCITTEEGLKIIPDSSINDEMWLDVLIVPGGYDMQALIDNQPLNDFIKRHETADKWLSSNCSGAFLLAHSGVLDGKKATTWYGGEEKLQVQHPLIDVQFDKPVVFDNRRVTSNGGVVSYQGAIVLLGKLSGADHAKEIYDGLAIGRLEKWVVIEAEIIASV